MNDSAFGHAAPIYPRKLPGLAEALSRLFENGDRIGRRYAAQSRGTELRVIQDGAAGAASSNFVIQLPTVIRGRLVSNLLEFVDLELAQPVQAVEVASDK